MTDTLVEPLPQQRPLAHYTQLETDLFCEHCGYNLHGQPVKRDERLGILICRCPECGRFHPAGHRTTATSVWLSRAAAMLLGLWVLIVLGVAGLATFMFGMFQFIPIEVLSYTVTVTVADGREVEHKQLSTNTWGPVYKGTDEPVVGAITHKAKIRAWPRSTHDWWEFYGTIHAINVGLGLATGILLVVFLWHWPRRRYAYALLLPLIALAFVICTLYLWDYYDWIRAWGVQQSLYYATVQCVALLVGLWVGRPLARGLVRAFVPPRPRQHLNFLWKVDGKTPPAVTMRTT